MATFRFAVSASRPRPRSEWIDFARASEAAGFDTLLMPDHLGARMAIAPALVLAAQATTRMRVGSFVYDNDFRHPMLLAQEAATIDLLTDGRFDFGIGAGWMRSEYDAAGINFDSGAVRVERLADAVRIIKGLLSQAPLTHGGRHYRLTDLASAFVTVQKPHPPFLIGGGGTKLLSLAASEADIISIMPRSKPDGSGLEDADASAASFDRKVTLIRQAAGERFPGLLLNTLVQAVVITGDRRQAALELAPDWAMSPDQLLESPLLLIGTVAQIAEQLLAHRERFGINYFTFFERDMGAFAPVIERVV